jgi:hypothetical protein
MSEAPPHTAEDPSADCRGPSLFLGGGFGRRANAVFALTGKRLRRLPLKLARAGIARTSAGQPARVPRPAGSGFRGGVS